MQPCAWATRPFNPVCRKESFQFGLLAWDVGLAPTVRIVCFSSKMLLEGIATVRSCAGSAFRHPSCGSESFSRGNESLQQSGFLGTALVRTEDVAGQTRQASRGMTVRALKETKPPVFILNKPERKLVPEDRKPLLSLENYDFDNLIVDPNHRSGNHSLHSLAFSFSVSRL